MTEPERRALRQAISDARRAALLRPQIQRAPDDPPRTTTHRCAWCWAAMPANPSRPAKRFCCDRCRKYAWYRETEKGREENRKRKRRAYARGGGIAAQRARQREEIKAR